MKRLALIALSGIAALGMALVFASLAVAMSAALRRAGGAR